MPTTNSCINKQGNRCNSAGGTNRKSTSYHYSNKNGSYYYKNDNGSTYYNNGRGYSKYTPASNDSSDSEPWPDTPTLAPDMIPTAARQSRQPRHPTAPTVARQPPTANNIFLDRHHVRALSRTPRQLPDSPDSPDRPDTR